MVSETDTFSQMRRSAKRRKTALKMLQPFRFRGRILLQDLWDMRREGDCRFGGLVTFGVMEDTRCSVNWVVIDVLHHADMGRMVPFAGDTEMQATVQLLVFLVSISIAMTRQEIPKVSCETIIVIHYVRVSSIPPPSLRSIHRVSVQINWSLSIISSVAMTICLNQEAYKLCSILSCGDTVEQARLNSGAVL